MDIFWKLSRRWYWISTIRVSCVSNLMTSLKAYKATEGKAELGSPSGYCAGVCGGLGPYNTGRRTPSDPDWISLYRPVANRGRSPVKGWPRRHVRCNQVFSQWISNGILHWRFFLWVGLWIQLLHPCFKHWPVSGMGYSAPTPLPTRLLGISRISAIKDLGMSREWFLFVLASRTPSPHTSFWETI